MVEAASEHGYAGATVSRVVRRAGVSRATFYEQFGDRDECFVAAYRMSLKAVRAAIGTAVEGSTDYERPEAVLDVLLSELATDPAMARLILVEVLAAPPQVRREHEELIVRVEGEVASFLDSQAPGGALQIPAPALLGGVGEVLARRLLAGEGKPLPHLREELVRWMATYRLSRDRPPLPQAHWSQLGRFSRLLRAAPEETLGLLPRGRSALAAEDAAAIRRRRILDATVQLIAEKGYSRLTVARIAAAARVPRNAFYSHFGGKEDAVLAAQTLGVQGAMGASASGYSPSGPWSQRVWGSLRAFFAYVAEHPEHARLHFVESFASGRAARQHREENRAVFALFLEEGYRQSPHAEQLPRICSEAIVAAVFGLMRKLVIEGKTERMLSLLPAAAYTVLAPYLGPAEAAAQVEDWSREAR